eukprot:2154229-Rhodomonas_salina.5
MADSPRIALLQPRTESASVRPRSFMRTAVTAASDSGRTNEANVKNAGSKLRHIRQVRQHVLGNSTSWFENQNGRLVRCEASTAMSESMQKGSITPIYGAMSRPDVGNAMTR